MGMSLHEKVPVTSESVCVTCIISAPYCYKIIQIIRKYFWFSLSVMVIFPWVSDLHIELSCQRIWMLVMGCMSNYSIDSSFLYRKQLKRYIAAWVSRWTRHRLSSYFHLLFNISDTNDRRPCLIYIKGIFAALYSSDTIYTAKKWR